MRLKLGDEGQVGGCAALSPAKLPREGSMRLIATGPYAGAGVKVAASFAMFPPRDSHAPHSVPPQRDAALGAQDARNAHAHSTTHTHTRFLPGNRPQHGCQAGNLAEAYVRRTHIRMLLILTTELSCSAYIL